MSGRGYAVVSPSDKTSGSSELMDAKNRDSSN